MRIGILGKGGSGKTTISAGLIAYAAANGKRVLAIDADHNVHLAQALGIDHNINLADHNEQVKQYFRGSRSDIESQPSIATTPPSLQSCFVHVKESDPFLVKYGTVKNNVILLQAGPYNEEDTGATCYHGKLEGVEALFHHLLDSEGDIVITDATAGIDSLGHSMHMVHDVVFYVVEPTLKSVTVAKKFIELTKESHVPVYMIANKIVDNQDVDFIDKHFAKDQILGYTYQSKLLRSFEQGERKAWTQWLTEQSDQFEQCLAKAENVKKDWKSYYERLLTMHKKSAEAWYDGFYGMEISKQQDKLFSYEKVL